MSPPQRRQPKHQNFSVRPRRSARLQAKQANFDHPQERLDRARETSPPTESEHQLCEVCKGIDLIKANDTRSRNDCLHHKSFANVRQSAANGCELCQMIVASALKGWSDTWDDAEDGQIYYYMFSPPSCLVFIRYSSFWSTLYASLRAFTHYDAPSTITRLCCGRPIEDNANSDFCFLLARTWMTICLEQHRGTCPYTTTSKMPTQVVDVGPDDGSQSPRLYFTRGQRGRWISLSHCWGQSSHFITDSQNLAERQKGMSLNDLPPTFRDAVEVTRRLGQRYLWVDSLCIIQDAREDWVQESSRMREYYRNSLLTIAVDSSSGDHEGFLLTPRSHLKRTSIPLGIHVPGEEIHQIYLESHEPIQSFYGDTTCLTSRAWTLQEDILSPRSLHYTSDHLVWQCQSQTFCESNIGPVEDYLGAKRFFLVPPKDIQVLKQSPTNLIVASNDPTLRWYSIVSDFVQRSLTFRDDKLPAISGIAREIQVQNGFTYKAGIWREDISRGLAWLAYGYGNRTEKYRAPSWSWAALEHPVSRSFKGVGVAYSAATFLDKYKPRVPRPGAEVLACDVVTAYGDAYGCISNGYIRLRGRMIPAPKCKSNTPPYFMAYWTNRKSHFLPRPNKAQPDGLDQLIYYFDQFPPGSDANTVNFNALSFLQLSTWDWSNGERDLVTIALILEPVDSMGNYQRVGIVHIPNYNGLAEDGWETKDVTIV